MIAERVGPAGRLIGLDQDPTMLERAKAHLAGLPVTLLHPNFDQLAAALASVGVNEVDGVLADLGFASDQVDAAERKLFAPTSGEGRRRKDSSKKACEKQKPC